MSVFNKTETMSFVGCNISGLILGVIKQKEYVKACKNKTMT